MEKNYIEIMKSDGSFITVEVVATFTLEESNKNCIIYRNNETKEYFAAAMNGAEDYVKFDVNFTDKEKEELNKILEELLKSGGNINA